MLPIDDGIGKPPMVKTVDARLHREQAWLEQQRGKKPDSRGRDRVENIFLACVVVLQLADLSGWLDRKQNRRRLLANRAKSYVSLKGNRALGDLLTLAISDLEATSPQSQRVEGLGMFDFAPKSASQQAALAEARIKRWESPHRGKGRKPESRTESISIDSQDVSPSGLTETDFRAKSSSTEIRYLTPQTL